MNYSYIDMHCDTLLYGVRHQLQDIYEVKETMLDIHRLEQAKTMCQFFAVFFPPTWEMMTEQERAEEDGYLRTSEEEYFQTARALLRDSLKAHSNIIRPAGCAEDVLRNYKKGNLSALLSIEDGRIVNGSMDRLIRLHEEGVRAISLTWNYANCFGYPNTRDAAKMQLGLTNFGKEAVSVMQDLGILIDVSHLSDGGFYDVAALAKKPFVATHSDCRALASHPRNLTDDMIRILAEKGGVTGLNFSIPFLNEEPGLKESRICDMVRHIQHMIQIGGEDCVGIGTDFDGIGGNLEVGEPGDMEKLFSALEAAGITPRQIDKIASENVLRVMKETMKGSISDEI